MVSNIPDDSPSLQADPGPDPASGERPRRPRRENPLSRGREILEKRPRFHIAYLLFALFGVVMLHDLWVSMRDVERIPYSEFQQLVDQEAVAEIVVQGDVIRGEFKGDREGKKQFVTNQVNADLAETLRDKDIVFSSRPESAFLPTLFSWLVPISIFFLVWMFLMRRMAGQMGSGGGLMAVGKSKAKVYVESDTGVSLDDVAGVDEAKAELQEIVEFLKAPEEYGRLGARMPKGVLLVGPPGTGKTLIARAVAGEAGVPFFSISGSEFVEMFVGVGAARVRDLFEQARTRAPAIIFIDELDALGRARSGGQPGLGGHDEKEQTLNQLLVELDGFDPSVGIVLLAATNRPEVLDPALLRAGRFDRQVLVDRPDRVGRIAILRVHLGKLKSAADVDPEKVAALTPGFTGADLANLVNEAALLATRRRSASVSMADFTAAIERIVAGLEKKNRLLIPREREVVAHHEMGHALVAAALPTTDEVHKVSIIPRGIGALGYTMQRPTEDRYLMTRRELEHKLFVLLGGRAAEFLVYGELSTGASDDLVRATDIARSMVTQYAMVPELGNATYADNTPGMLGNPAGVFQPRRYSEATAREIDVAVRAIVDEAFERACQILERNRPLLDESAAALLESETLSEQDLVPFFEKVVLPAPDAAPEIGPLSQVSRNGSGSGR
jgi:cell division protease FtsH